MWIETEAPIFLFWEYLFRNFGILSLQCAPLSIVYKKPIKKQGGALNFKGGRADFLKISAPLSLINVYQMNLISAGAIYGRHGIYLKGSMLIKELGRC